MSALGVVAIGWAAGALALAIRRFREPVAAIVALIAVALGAAATGSPIGVAAVPAAGSWLLLSAPEGRLVERWRRLAVVGAVIVAAATAAVLWPHRPAVRVVPVVVESALLAAIGVAGYAMRCRDANATDRARLQWLGWGIVVAATITVAAAGSSVVVGVPRHMDVVAAVASLLVPASLVAATFEAAVVVIDRVLVRTIVVAGLIAMIEIVYLLVVIGLGHVPTASDRQVLALSMVAAGLAALLAHPVRRRLEDVANQRVYGATHAPDQPLQTFAARMSRAIPLDELLLQLAESLSKQLRLTGAEVWTGTEGVLERAASVPDRGPARLVLAGEELGVVARAHVSGPAWAQVWLPDLVAGRQGAVLRIASISHLGDLLGLIVVERAADDLPFSEADELLLAETARPLGLALHNVRLDSALQASLDELRLRNDELRASRSRIVAASDSSRRQIERNLHDGAQQHLVAMAVKIGLARQLLESDPDTAATMLEELRADVQGTLTELRELAHGIYPPLLRDRGLPEALQTAANRATLETCVDADGIERYPEGVETAVYFCCLEAMQNAGKHAGDGAHLAVRVRIESLDPTTEADGQALVFSVQDDGAGFEVSEGGHGHGFVNMRDRLGAIGGELEVVSACGRGTTVTGRIPLDGAAPDELPG
jgi:signal transduction histidine kinase